MWWFDFTVRIYWEDRSCERYCSHRRKIPLRHFAEKGIVFIKRRFGRQVQYFRSSLSFGTLRENEDQRSAGCIQKPKLRTVLPSRCHQGSYVRSCMVACGPCTVWPQFYERQETQGEPTYPFSWRLYGCVSCGIWWWASGAWFNLMGTSAHMTRRDPFCQ